MWICIDKCVVQFSVIIKERFSDLISLKDLLIRIVVMWFLIRTPNILQFGWRMDQRPLKHNYNESLAISLLDLHVLCVLRAFSIFKGLWWKFFGALEAWIRRASLICCFLNFLEAFELDFSELWDLRRWFGWFLFECSSYSKVYGRSSSEFLGLEFVEFHWFVVSWSFWRLLGLISSNFKI